MRRIERYCGDLTAASTSDSNLDPLFDPGRLSICYCRKPLILGMFTLLASFGRVLEVLVSEKGLFSRRPDEIATAVDASNGRVLKFRFLGVWRVQFRPCSVKITIRHNRIFTIAIQSACRCVGGGTQLLAILTERDFRSISRPVITQIRRRSPI